MAPTTGGNVILHTKIALTPSETPVDVRFTGLGPVDRVLHAIREDKLVATATG